MRIDRRSFIKNSAAAVTAAGLGGWGTARANTPERPNILIVLDDQERQPMHSPPLSLPNRDRLRRHAVEFTNAYCTYPLCSPSRATLMTGRYPHEVGINTNVDFAAKNPSLRGDIPNLANVFSAAGYHTVYFGKWHLSRRARSSGNLRKYGFDSPHISNQLYAIGSDPRVTENTAQWITERKDKSPWLMIYSPINPHDICFPFLDKLYTGNMDRTLSLPPNFSLEKSPDIRTVREFEEFAFMEMYMPHTEQEWLDYLRFYYFLIEDVDRNLGLVLDALEQSGQWGNTITIFTSDHGEMGSSHGLHTKGPTMYEETMNIPLWISDPRRMSGFRQCDSLVSNLDLVPTISSLAGVRWPEPLPGIDLTPALRGVDGIEREQLFAEGALRQEVAWRGIRTKEWKYWHYSNGEEVLFNVKDDPLEMNNLAGDHEANDALVRFRDKVRQWRKETNDPLKKFID